jgi:hypothetical protein
VTRNGGKERSGGGARSQRRKHDYDHGLIKQTSPGKATRILEPRNSPDPVKKRLPIIVLSGHFDQTNN